MKHIPTALVPRRKSLRSSALIDCVNRYKESLTKREDVYHRVQDEHPASIKCAPNCNECCYHIFVIRILDLFLVREKWMKLGFREQQSLSDAALYWSATHQDLPPGLFVGKTYDIDAIKGLEDAFPDGGVACPFLSPGNGCTIYADRPMLCRAHGYPELTMLGEMESTCYKNLAGFSSSALESYSLPARRYIEIVDLKQELFSILGIAGWEGFVLGTGLVIPILLDPAEIDWPRLIEA